MLSPFSFRKPTSLAYSIHLDGTARYQIAETTDMVYWYVGYSVYDA
jgi:hypothetical protein